MSEEAKRLMKNIKVIDDWLETAQVICTKTNGKTKYDFSKFTFSLKFSSKFIIMILRYRKHKIISKNYKY